MVAWILAMSQGISVCCITALIFSTHWLQALDDVSSTISTLFCVLFSIAVICFWRAFSQDIIKSKSMLPYLLCSLLAAEASLLHFIAFHLSSSSLYIYCHSLALVTILSHTSYITSHPAIYITAFCLCSVGLLTPFLPHASHHSTSAANVLAMYTALGFQFRLCTLEGVNHMLIVACLAGTYTTIIAAQASLLHAVNFITILPEQYIFLILMICTSALATLMNVLLVTFSSVSLTAIASSPALLYYTIYQWILSPSSDINMWYLVSAVCGVMFCVLLLCCTIFCRHEQSEIDVMPPTPGNVCVTDGEEASWLNDIDYAPLVEPSEAGTEVV